MWSLADNSGQVWTHNDLNWLRQWVAARNQALASGARVGQSSSYFFPASQNCPGGVCPPRR